jgi:hypothetical protein
LCAEIVLHRLPVQGFAALADGKILHATHRIFSPKLKEPIVYTLTYQRE